MIFYLFDKLGDGLVFFDNGSFVVFKFVEVIKAEVFDSVLGDPGILEPESFLFEKDDERHDFIFVLLLSRALLLNEGFFVDFFVFAFSVCHFIKLR